MAERRMFAKTIVTSDAFLDMPHSARCLYFTLNLFADDDGFVNSPKSIMRQTGATVDDMNLLITKKFVLVFDSGVIVIKHWRIHNYIRGDRKHDTKYAEEMAMLTTDEKGAYTLGEATPQLESPDDEPEMTLRQRAYKESELPYSFDYKIRKAFYGKPCPMCGALMQTDIEDGIVTKHHLPTIQHNLPIAKGGRHELGNISVICHACNVSTRDNPTEDLNADEVIEAWEDICQTNGRQVAGKCHTEDRLGKDRLGENVVCDMTDLLTADEIHKLYAKYENAHDLIEQVQEEVNRKHLQIQVSAYAYIVGYARNKGWCMK